MPYSTVLDEVLHEVQNQPQSAEPMIPELRLPLPLPLQIDEGEGEGEDGDDPLMDEEDELEASHNELQAVMCMERLVQGVVTACSCYIAHKTLKAQNQQMCFPLVLRAGSFAFSCRALAGLVLEYDWVFRSHAYPMTAIQIGATAACPSLGHIVSGVMTGWFLGGALLPRLLIPSVHGVHTHPGVAVGATGGSADSSDVPATLNRTMRSFNFSNRSNTSRKHPSLNGGHSQLTRDKERQIDRWKKNMEPLLIDTNGDGVRDSVVVDTTGDGILDAVIPVRRIGGDGPAAPAPAGAAAGQAAQQPPQQAQQQQAKAGAGNRSTPTASTANGSGSELLAQSARRQSSFLEIPPPSAASQPAGDKAKARPLPAAAGAKKVKPVGVPALQDLLPGDSPKHLRRDADGSTPQFGRDQPNIITPLSPGLAPRRGPSLSPSQSQRGEGALSMARSMGESDVGRVIDFRDVNVVRRIGTGHTSTVYLADWRGVEVAVKEMPLSDEVLREAETQQLVNHPHIVQCFGYSLSRSKLFVVMEYCDEGSLESYLVERRRNRHPVTVKDVLDIAQRISLAMMSVHADGCIHRDLAARNVFKNGPCYKLGDFGLVREVDSRDGGVYKVVGKSADIPVNWTAPEALAAHEFTKAGDVWSFGVLLWEVLVYCSKRPYDRSADKCEQRVLAGEILERPEGCPEMLWESLVARCFFPEQERPTFRKIAQDIIPSILSASTTKPQSFYESDGAGPPGLSDCYKSLGDDEPSCYGPTASLCLTDVIHFEGDPPRQEVPEDNQPAPPAPPASPAQGGEQSPALGSDQHLLVKGASISKSHSGATVSSLPARARNPAAVGDSRSSECDNEDSILQCNTLSRGSSLGDVSSDEPHHLKAGDALPNHHHPHHPHHPAPAVNGGSHPTLSPITKRCRVVSNEAAEQPEQSPQVGASNSILKLKTSGSGGLGAINGPAVKPRSVPPLTNSSFGVVSKQGSILNNSSMRISSQASAKGSPRGTLVTPRVEPRGTPGLELALSVYAQYTDAVQFFARLFNMEAPVSRLKGRRGTPVRAPSSTFSPTSSAPLVPSGAAASAPALPAAPAAPVTVLALQRQSAELQQSASPSTSPWNIPAGRLLQLTPFIAFCAVAAIL